MSILGENPPKYQIDWFHNPLDDLPIVQLTTQDLKIEKIADAYASRQESTPDFEKDAEEIVTMHDWKAYREQ